MPPAISWRITCPDNTNTETSEQQQLLEEVEGAADLETDENCSANVKKTRATVERALPRLNLSAAAATKGLRE